MVTMVTQREVLLPTAPAEQSPMLTWRRICGNVSSRICHEPHWLYCNGLLAGAPKEVTNKLQRVINSAARIVSNTWKFYHGLTHVRHDILHWLDVPERVTFKLAYAWPSTSVCTEWDRYICRRCAGRARRRLVVVTRSANRGQLVVPRYRLTTASRRAFSCAGPSAWNSLPEYLTFDTLTLDYFKRSLKCFLFARYWHSAWSALGICNDSALYKCTLNNNKKA